MNVHRIVASVSAVALVATVALAQRGYVTRRDEARVHLKSDNYHYSSKTVRNRGVRLVRQRSNSPCVRGRSWGADRNKIWVNRGCEADFAYVKR